MKLILLLYLEDDDARVARMLDDLGVPTWSRLPLEGHGAGLAGWYGEVSPYRSRMAFTMVDEERADQLLAAVGSLDGLSDPSHPVHALELCVDRAAESK